MIQMKTKPGICPFLWASNLYVSCFEEGQLKLS